MWFRLRASSIAYSMTFLARGVCGSLPIVTVSGPLLTSFSTSSRTLRRSTSRFFSTLAPTPEPSFTSPSRMCSVPMYSWLKRCASWFASAMTFRARSVKRSNIGSRLLRVPSCGYRGVGSPHKGSRLRRRGLSRRPSSRSRAAWWARGCSPIPAGRPSGRPGPHKHPSGGAEDHQQTRSQIPPRGPKTVSTAGRGCLKGRAGARCGPPIMCRGSLKRRFSTSACVVG